MTPEESNINFNHKGSQSFFSQSPHKELLRNLKKGHKDAAMQFSLSAEKNISNNLAKGYYVCLFLPGNNANKGPLGLIS